jgi:RNA polymerase sigma-70 factor, ECF subfamily
MEQELNINNQKDTLSTVITEEKYFADLFNENKDKLANYIVKIVGCVTTTNDILQDVMVKGWLQRRRLKGITKKNELSFFLLKMARNESLNYLKKSKRTSQYVSLYKEHAGSLQVSFRDAEQRVLLEELNKIFSIASDKLSPRKRQIYKMMAEDGKKYKEVAAELNISPRTVLATRQQINKCLMDYMDELMKVGGPEA